jgi:hypothetical protein
MNEIRSALLAQSDKGHPRSCLGSDRGLRSPWNAQTGKAPGVVVFVKLCPFDGTAIRIKDAAHIAILGQQLASCLDRRVA